MKNILSILLLLLAFTACGDKKAVTDVLNRAESLMNEHPDSALNLLRTLTFDDFQKEKNRARYALLHSQALDKNYIDVTSDSLISIAVDYYKDEDDVRSKFLSYYYMGRVHANGERYLQTTSCLMESEQLVEEVGDDYLSGLLYSEMGRIYRLYYDYPKSLEAYQKAAENRTDSANLCIVAAEVYSLQGKGEAAYRELLKGVVYQRRLRLRSEIESSECLHKKLYLRLLGK